MENGLSGILGVHAAKLVKVDLVSDKGIATIQLPNSVEKHAVEVRSRMGSAMPMLIVQLMENGILGEGGQYAQYHVVVEFKAVEEPAQYHNLEGSHAMASLIKRDNVIKFHVQSMEYGRFGQNGHPAQKHAKEALDKE